jgi:hypothetical protein
MNTNRFIKNIFFTSLSLLTICFLSLKSYGQCNPTIPTTSNIVSSSQTVDGGFTPQWVCTGSSFSTNGGAFNVFLESGAVMSTGGGIDSIYVKAGATLNMNGGIHHIFFEPLAILNILGGISYVDTCVSINYDYSQAPAGGCLFTSLNNIHLSDVNFSVAPNPAKDQLTIETTKATTIEIMNVLGEKLVDRTIDKKEVITIANFNKGIYFIKDLTTGKTIKFVKE